MEEIKELTAEEKARQIARYERFIESRLKPDLESVARAQKKVDKQLSALQELRNNIVLLQKNNMEELTTLVDMGSSFYVQAQIPDTSRIYVEVGLGFRVEFTLDEALSFIGKKEAYLNEFAETLSKKATNIKNHIQRMYEGIAQLMS